MSCEWTGVGVITQVSSSSAGLLAKIIFVVDARKEPLEYQKKRVNRPERLAFEFKLLFRRYRMPEIYGLIPFILQGFAVPTSLLQTTRPTTYSAHPPLARLGFCSIGRLKLKGHCPEHHCFAWLIMQRGGANTQAVLLILLNRRH